MRKKELVATRAYTETLYRFIFMVILLAVIYKATCLLILVIVNAPQVDWGSILKDSALFNPVEAAELSWFIPMVLTVLVGFLALASGVINFEGSIFAQDERRNIARAANTLGAASVLVPIELVISGIAAGENSRTLPLLVAIGAVTYISVNLGRFTSMTDEEKRIEFTRELKILTLRLKYLGDPKANWVLAVLVMPSIVAVAVMLIGLVIVPSSDGAAVQASLRLLALLIVSSLAGKLFFYIYYTDCTSHRGFLLVMGISILVLAILFVVAKILIDLGLAMGIVSLAFGLAWLILQCIPLRCMPQWIMYISISGAAAVFAKRQLVVSLNVTILKSRELLRNSG